MKTKQEILDKENRPFLNMMQMETAFVTEQGALAAMESYATQQLAEQHRKIEELRNDLEKVNSELHILHHSDIIQSNGSIIGRLNQILEEEQ